MTVPCRLSMPLLLLPAFAACATTGAVESTAPEGDHVYSEDEVDVLPERRGCPAEPNPTLMRGVVILEYVVTEEGDVAPGTVRAVPRHNFDWARRPSTAFVARAAEIAGSCMYLPGRVDGEPVPVRVRHRLAFAR